MPGRTYSSDAYRYGFNGKEKDDKGEWGQTHYDYGFRIYNPSIAKFLSVDPLTKSYPELTPYQFASNRPIDGVDLDGLEYVKADLVVEDGEPKLTLKSVKEFEIFGWKYSSATTFEVNYNGDAFVFETDPGNKGGLSSNNINDLAAFVNDPEGQRENFVSRAEQYGEIFDAWVAVEFAFPNGLPGPRRPRVKDPVKEIVIPKKYPESHKHAVESMKSGTKNTGVVDRQGSAARRRKNFEGIKTQKKKDRDEFPPAVIKTDSKGTVKVIDSSDNRGAGQSIGQQLKGVPEGTRVKIVPEP